MTFELYPFRFRFIARDSISFPTGKGGNVIRGALGYMFRKVACVPSCPGPQTCQIRSQCLYARLFEPMSLGEGPSGYSDLPRPFVIRAGHLDGSVLTPDSRFHFDVHIFDRHELALPYFVLSFSELVREGIGPRRGRAELEAVDQLDGDRKPFLQVFDGKTITAPPRPLILSLDPVEGGIQRATVRFLSPTELKDGGTVVSEPTFDILFSRIRDRISTLRALYGSGPLAIDFKGMASRAAAVKMVRCNVHHIPVERRSSRTGQTHPLGGFVGEAEYEGDLGEFLPFFEAARWTGVGRQTVWGKGAIELNV